MYPSTNASAQLRDTYNCANRMFPSNLRMNFLTEKSNIVPSNLCMNFLTEKSNTVLQ